MKMQKFSAKTWAIEFFLVLVASFIVNIFAIFAGIIENLFSTSQIIIFYVLFAIGTAVYLMIANIKRYIYIFYLRPAYRELHKANLLEQDNIKKYKKEEFGTAGIRILSFVVVFTVIMGLTGENKEFSYLLLTGLFGGVFISFVSYPEFYLNYLTKVCVPHLEIEPKEYVQSFKMRWFDYLPFIIALIGINLYLLLR